MYDTLVAQEHFIVGEGSTTWLDGTISGQCGFHHALYQQVLHDQVGQAQRVRLHRQLGRIEEGLAAIAEAVHLTEAYANLCWAAEVYCLQGVLFLATTGQAKAQAKAEECWHKALHIARQQEAKSLE